jgi:hypothetical protein
MWNDCSIWRNALKATEVVLETRPGGKKSKEELRLLREEGLTKACLWKKNALRNL